MEKQTICPHCNEPLEQGHRVDRCEDLESSKIYVPSNNKMYMPSKYKGMTFERIETPDSSINMISGSKTRPVTKERYVEAIKNTIKVLQDKLDKIETGKEI